MLNIRATPMIFMILLIIGCGHQRSTTIGDGLFQKRQHRSGWHLDLGMRMQRSALPLEQGRKGSRIPDELAELGAQEPFSPRTELSIATAVWAEPLAAVGNVMETSPTTRPTEHFAASIESQRAAHDTSNIMPRKRFNVFAIPSLLFVAAGITFAFTTNSALLVLAMLVVGLVLAAISLRRIRSKEQSGKGFALTALILGVLAALITTMVIIRTGF
jgi:hypothetical protein